MFIAYTCDTDDQVSLFISERYSIRILHNYDTRFLNGLFRIRCAMWNCYAHSHVCSNDLLTLYHCIDIISIYISQVTQELSCCTDCCFFIYACTSCLDSFRNKDSCFCFFLFFSRCFCLICFCCLTCCQCFQFCIQCIQMWICKEVLQRDQSCLRCTLSCTILEDLLAYNYVSVCRYIVYRCVSYGNAKIQIFNSVSELGSSHCG